MKNLIQITKILLILFFILNITGCGKAGHTLLIAPQNLSDYKDIYISEITLSSKEQSENAQKLNEEMMSLTRAELKKALEQKGTYKILQDTESSSAHLTLETNIEIVYGSRALRYFVGMGAGSGSCKISMKLKDSSSGEAKYETKSESKLVGGGAGGSMDNTVRNNIIDTVKQFVDRM